MGVSYTGHLQAEHPLALRMAENQSSSAAVLSKSAKKTDTTEAAWKRLRKRDGDWEYRCIHQSVGTLFQSAIANFVLMGYGTGAVMSGGGGYRP